MKIAVVRRRWVADGGGERFTAALAEALAERDNDVTIVSAGWAPSAGRVRHQRIPMVADRGELVALLTFTLAAARALRDHPYDIVHSHEKLLWQDVYRAGDGCHREWLRQRRRHRPGWRTRLAPWTPYHRLVLALERRALGGRRFRRIVANSERVRADLQRHYAVPTADVRVVHNGVDLRRFAPAHRARFRDAVRAELEIPRDVALLLFLGSGFERKGLTYLLRSLRDVPDDMWALVVGQDLRIAAYRELAARLGVASRVRFAGSLREPERAYAAADAFVLPTIYEPFSNACLEAMASGLPVITTRGNGVAEVFTPALRDLVLDDARDVAALASRIGALRDPDARAALGREARRAAEPCSLDHAIDGFVAVYRELTRCPKEPAASP